MYAAEAGRLEVRFQKHEIFHYEDDIQNHLFFLYQVGRLLLAGLEEEKWGEEDRAERKSRLDRQDQFFVTFSNVSSRDPTGQIRPALAFLIHQK